MASAQRRRDTGGAKNALFGMPPGQGRIDDESLCTSPPASARPSKILELIIKEYRGEHRRLTWLVGFRCAGYIMEDALPPKGAEYA